MKVSPIIIRTICAAVTFMFGAGVVLSLFENRFETTRGKNEMSVIGNIPDQSDSKNLVFLSDSDASAIYNAILSEQCKNDELLIISEQTNIDNWVDQLEYYNVLTPQFSPETIDNFKAKNKETARFIGDFKFCGRYSLMTKQEEKQLFQDPDGWDKFHQNYHGSKRILHLSKIGFNHSGEEALVSIVIEAQYANTISQFFILRKINGTWTVKAFKSID